VTCSLENKGIKDRQNDRHYASLIHLPAATARAQANILISM
jgi:hypothetical protein